MTREIGYKPIVQPPIHSINPVTGSGTNCAPDPTKDWSFGIEPKFGQYVPVLNQSIDKEEDG